MQSNNALHAQTRRSNIYIDTTTPMTTADLTRTLTHIAEELSEAKALKGIFHQHTDGHPIPSGDVLKEIVDLLRAIIFPGYYGKSTVNSRTIKFHVGVNVEKLNQLLTKQIQAGLCFANCDGCEPSDNAADMHGMAQDMAMNLIQRLPLIRQTLAADVAAIYNGDPAAGSFGEVISCYPAVKAMVNYRVAHELLLMGVPLIPRMLTEMAHSETGIDIHPAAQIGQHFAIDHGTGVVIGATCIIGNHVKLYQGVTLGARSFPVDDEGKPIKGIERHPILEDGVVVYSNATILGRVTIGKGSVVGANVWVTVDMEPNTRIFKKKK